MLEKVGQARKGGKGKGKELGLTLRSAPPITTTSSSSTTTTEFQKPQHNRRICPPAEYKTLVDQAVMFSGASISYIYAYKVINLIETKRGINSPSPSFPAIPLHPILPYPILDVLYIDSWSSLRRVGKLILCYSVISYQVIDVCVCRCDKYGTVWYSW